MAAEGDDVVWAMHAFEAENPYVCLRIQLKALLKHSLLQVTRYPFLLGNRL